MENNFGIKYIMIYNQFLSVLAKERLTTALHCVVTYIIYSSICTLPRIFSSDGAIIRRKLD